jgi:hypothetical protein
MFRVSIRLVPIVAALLALPALASAQVLEIGVGGAVRSASAIASANGHGSPAARRRAGKISRSAA